jgi:signal transduction histidine kinase
LRLRDVDRWVATVRSIVDAHGGSIEVESGRGSATFTMSLPVR